jgi:RNA polymerase sigma-70 factor (ECF subfamily)
MMATGERFRALLRRLRAGDADAATELVQQYEPAIRRIVRGQLTNSRLGRLIDSADVCQSVLANFFVRFGAGQFEVEEPQQLLQLLLTMARHRLRDQVRKQQAARRDQRRLAADGDAALQGVADDATPSRIVAGRELLEKVRQELSPDERRLADQRGLGWGWAEIAAEVGGTPDALRMKLNRAVDRVAQRLGLDEVPDA